MFQLGRKPWVLLFLYVVGVSGYIYYLYGETQSLINESINSRLLQAALATSAILGDRYHDNLLDKSSKSEAEDLDAILRLSKYNQSIGLAFVYTVVKRQGALYLSSSSASSEEIQGGDFVRFFDPYPDASPELAKSFERSDPTWVDYSDHWGDFRAVFVPLRSQDGSLYVAGAEMPLADYHQLLRQDSLHHIGLALLVFLAFGLWFAIDLWRVRLHLQQLQLNEQRLKQAKDAAEAADRSKTKFLATMSHEIRTPLYGVIGSSELLIGTPLNAEQNDWLNTIHCSGQALLALIDDVLDLAKIEAGKLELRPRVFAVRELLDDSAQMVRQHLLDKPVTLQVQVAGDVPVLIKADAERLRQVLLNLLGNAAKFTEAGEIVLALTVQQAGPRTRLTFAVRDTGIGIGADQQDGLFSAFTQLEEGSGPRHRGSGLGLSICKSLVEALGGALAFSSQKGVGSVFSFCIAVEPFHPVEIPVEDRQDQVEFTPSFAQRFPLRILLAEDNPVNQRIAVAMLQKLGYQPAVVADGMQALERCQRECADVILMDINMPTLDGLQATRGIRLLDRGEACYIVAFTASAFANEIERCLSAGASDYLTKPVTLQSLARVLQRAARHRQRLPSAAATGT
ncbi:MAG: ATP-binding protein [Pseudomonas sp.]|uniref:ATP-binding protein n=1 Tax=Pseudomonas sp. TaxID=306 RepID=UPI00339402BB